MTAGEHSPAHGLQTPRAFEFATAARIIFGAGTAKSLREMVSELGCEVLIVTGSGAERVEPIVSALRDSTCAVHSFVVAGEPTVETADLGAAYAREIHAQVVVAIGGGSVIDAGKAIAALATNDGTALEYLEVVGAGKKISRPALPLVAVPTTAGTGAEVTRNAVLGVPAERVKASLRSPWLLPRIALVDPELTYSLPAPLTAATGMDALTQVIEPFLSSRATALTDAICRDGIVRAARALPVVFRDPGDSDARADMALASLFGGLALANSGLGAVHGFAAPIGGMFDVAHGAVCAALLPHVLAANLAAMRDRAPRHPGLHRMAELARMLTGDSNAQPDDAVARTRDLAAQLNICGLAALGVRPGDHAEIAVKAAQASSMKANPILLTHTELMRVLDAAC